MASSLRKTLAPLLLVTILSLASAAVLPTDHSFRFRNSTNPEHMVGRENSFDYVIVGGGTAGLTLAARLAESSLYSVAVIEAGGYYEADNGNLSVVPAYWIYGAGTDPQDINPAVDWGFITQPQEVCHQLLISTLI